jgi:endonuclease G
MIKFISIIYVAISLNAVSLSDFVDTKDCDQIIDKQLYIICYSYKYKGALSGWVTLYGNLVNKNNIKKRARFYSEKSIDIKYRTKYKDYTGYGKRYNRGHFIVADADFDYNKIALNKAYTMANIIPQSAMINQKTWIKVEKYGRFLAKKFGYINSISIAKYEDLSNKIGIGIVIPTKLYRIYYNNEAKFEKCFMYKNHLNIDYKNDKLVYHEVDCGIN